MYKKYLGKKLLKENYEIVGKNGYWIINSNKYSVGEYTEKEALEASKTLKNCKNCIDCEDCEDCKDCYKCRDCEDCEDCESCSFCGSLLSCEDCIDCHESNNLRDCEDCYECEYVTSGKGLHGVLNNGLYEESEESDELLDTDFRFIEKMYKGPNNLLEIYVPNNKYVCKIIEEDMRYWESKGKIVFKFAYKNNIYGFTYHNEDGIDRWCTFYKNDKKICTLEIYDEEEIKPNCYMIYFK